jgi:FixJ family two-component response regulator
MTDWRNATITEGWYKLQKIEANNQQQQRKKTFIVWGIAVAAILGFGALFIVGYRMKRAERAKRQAVVDEQKKIIHKLNSTLKKETKVSRKVANDAVYVNAVKFLDTMKSNPELVSRWTEADWRQIYVLVDDIDKGNIRAFLNNVEELNEREKQVFMLSILGINTKQLGEIFSLAPVTVSNIKLKGQEENTIIGSGGGAGQIRRADGRCKRPAKEMSAIRRESVF